MLRAVKARGGSVRVCFCVRRYGPKHLVHVDSGCAVLEHAGITCLLQTRVRTGMLVSRALHVASGGALADAAVPARCGSGSLVTYILDLAGLLVD